MRYFRPKLYRRAAHAQPVVISILALFVAMPSCYADDLFGEAVPLQTLAMTRGGDNDTSDSNNVVLTSGSTQNIAATNQNNTITAGGDVVAGNVTISNDAFTDMHGMTNVVVNTAPMANVQGIMSLNLVLH